MLVLDDQPVYDYRYNIVSSSITTLNLSSDGEILFKRLTDIGLNIEEFKKLDLRLVDVDEEPDEQTLLIKTIKAMNR